jgi:hypothetical protein
VLAELALSGQSRPWVALARCHAAGQVEHGQDRDIDAAISSAVYRIGEAADRTEWLAMDLTEVRAITAHLESPHPPSVVTPTRVMEDSR